MMTITQVNELLQQQKELFFVVKFEKYEDRARILQKAKYLKGTKIYINEDFTDDVIQKRKELLPKLKAARDRGEIAYLRHDKLSLSPHQYSNTTRSSSTHGMLRTVHHQTKKL